MKIARLRRCEISNPLCTLVHSSSLIVLLPDQAFRSRHLKGQGKIRRSFRREQPLARRGLVAADIPSWNLVADLLSSRSSCRTVLGKDCSSYRRLSSILTRPIHRPRSPSPLTSRRLSRLRSPIRLFFLETAWFAATFLSRLCPKPFPLLLQPTALQPHRRLSSRCDSPRPPSRSLPSSPSPLPSLVLRPRYREFDGRNKLETLNIIDVRSSTSPRKPPPLPSPRRTRTSSSP